MLVYTFISLTLVLLAIDAADVFLTQRAMASAADGAALAAAQSVDKASFYAGGNCALPISLPAADQAVGNLLPQSAATDAVQVSVDPAGQTVTVILSQRVRLPLQGLLGALVPRWAAGVPVRVGASARSSLSVAGC